MEDGFRDNDISKVVEADRAHVWHHLVQHKPFETGEPRIITEGKGTLVLLLAYTGVRWGEAIGLRVADLDMLRKRALIHENAVQSGTGVHVGTPKAHKQRSIPLPEFLVKPLARQCEGKQRTDLLFGDGEHLRRPHPVSGWFAKAVVAAGVPRVTPHDLRHTAASLAVSAGANVKAVQRMLGHASAAMTLDLYADLFDDDLEAVATALDQARTATIGSSR